jgi:hypothetical protein
MHCVVLERSVQPLLFVFLFLFLFVQQSLGLYMMTVHDILNSFMRSIIQHSKAKTRKFEIILTIESGSKQVIFPALPSSKDELL